MTAQISLTNCQTLVEILRWRAENQPNKRAYTFLRDGEKDELHITYAELDQQARAIGSLLQEMDATGERVLLLYPSGLDFITAFFGCLYAGAVAVPTYPARYDRSNRRLQAIVRDAQPVAVLTDTSEHLIAEVADLEWLVTDNIGPWLASEWEEPALSGDTLAFLQYTSGSTAMPKGVMVTHHNLMHNLAAMQASFEVTSDDSGVTWLPLYHDMGLIGGILLALYVGGLSTVMSPLAFLQNPLRWLEAISRTKAIMSAGPNFAYDLCVEKIQPHEREGLDLSNWQLATNGAEPIRAGTIERFVAAFEPYGFRREAFYPCYGLAEATLFVSGGLRAASPIVSPLDGENSYPIVGCGQSSLGQQILIVDADSHLPCLDGQVGEIWVKGASVAKGYWNKTKATEDTYPAKSDTFHAYLANKNLPVGHDRGPFLRTGDLGFLLDGDLFVTGRLKDLIIIRGRNYYPQDLELTAENSHSALQPNAGAAFSVDVEQQERLVIMFELTHRHRHANVDEVAAAIRTAVNQEHQLEVYGVVLIAPARLPKTTSGKVQRYACRQGFLEDTLPVIGASIRTNEPQPTQGKVEKMTTEGPTRADIEVKLRAKVAEFLSVPPSAIDLEEPVSSLGLGSMVAVSLQSYIEKEFGYLLPIEVFFEEISSDELITQIWSGVQPKPLAQPDSILPQGTADLQEQSPPVSIPSQVGGYLHNALYRPSLFQSAPHSAKRDQSSKERQSKARADELIKWLRGYANERINSFLIDERRTIPPYIVLDFGNRGLLGMQIPEQYGGLELNYTESIRVLQQLTAIDLTLAIFVGNNHILGTRPIINYGQPEVRDELLPAIAQGRELAAFALTEPGAGSNPRAISTTAVSDGKGGWRLRGQKSWVGFGSWAGAINIFAQTVDHHGNSLGLSAFVVRQGSEGLRQGAEALTVGVRGFVQNTIYLNDVPVGPQNLLGRVGGGMEVVQDAMMLARFGVAAISVGAMKRCAQLMVRYAERRTIVTGRLLDNPVTLTRLNNLTAAITAVETLVARVTMLLDEGLAVPKEVYLACKTSGPEFLWQAADHLVQLLGGRGYIETNIAPKILRDARVLRIFEGPTEPISMFLGECVVNRGQELAQSLSAWGAPEIAQELLQVAAQIKHCWMSQTTPFSARHQAYALTGEVATFAILHAALQSAPKSQEIEHAMGWVQREYKQRVERALTPLSTPSSTFFDAASISRQVAGYTESIGNLEQSLAGEEHGLDEQLRLTI